MLHYRAEDVGLRRFRASGKADKQALTHVQSPRRGRRGAADLDEQTGLSRHKLTRAVSLLEQAGTVTVDERARVSDADDRRPAKAGEDADNVAEARREDEQSRVDPMRGYAETLSCRRQYLLPYFGEMLEQPSGSCDTCVSGSALQLDVVLSRGLLTVRS